MLKELRALTPFSWDTKGAPLGPAMTADFDKVRAIARCSLPSHAQLS